MAEPDTQQGKLYTLSEISKKSGISMPTLQRYKKTYQSRIPSVGQGRKQRYPESALPVFNDIKVENAGRRGRPRKTEAAGAAAARPAAKRRGRPRKEASGGGGLLTLTEISKRTGISYPTLVRYVRLYADRLPSEGIGRARRFYSQAVDVFRQLRSESPRGGRRKRGGGAKRAASSNGRRRGARSEDGAIAKRIKQIEKTQQSLEKRFKKLGKTLQNLFR
jgi:predicted DNA-binding transcriptional regulator AlpA